ncbi:MAG TPA: hypothetical protein VFM14_16380 [Gemmatimonadales bacterium]|nr:hypothetical protein [Gemmatimonadales bacterium]
MESLDLAPVKRITRPSGEPNPAAIKRRKRLEKRWRDVVRPPESFERFRILAELVEEGRRLVEIADHKARYALIVLGVLNAGVYVVLTRSDLTSAMPPEFRLWVIGALFAYAIATLGLMLHALDCLRPRLLGGAEHLGGRPSLFCWDAIAASDVAAYRASWNDARMNLINDEAVVVAYRVSRIIAAKYRALQRLYTGLSALVVLGGLLLAAYAALRLRLLFD